MLADLTSKQLSEWQAYDTLDPVGNWREDYRLAFLSSLITNIAIKRFGEKGAVLTSIDDFMFVWDKKDTEEKDDKLVRQIKSIMSGVADDFKYKGK